MWEYAAAPISGDCPKKTGRWTRSVCRVDDCIAVLLSQNWLLTQHAWRILSIFLARVWDRGLQSLWTVLAEAYNSDIEQYGALQFGEVYQVRRRPNSLGTALNLRATHTGTAEHKLGRSIVVGPAGVRWMPVSRITVRPFQSEVKLSD